MSPILLKVSMTALKTFLHKTVDKIFVFFQNRDFGPESSRNRSLCEILNIFLHFTPSTPHKRRYGSKSSKPGMKLHPRKIDHFRYRHPRMLLRLLKLAVLALFDPITSHIQTNFSTRRRVATTSASQGFKMPITPSISPCWFFDFWVNTPTWPALFPPAYVLGYELVFFSFKLQFIPRQLSCWICLSTERQAMPNQKLMNLISWLSQFKLQKEQSVPPELRFAFLMRTPACFFNKR